jgi:DNA-binding beta-propeller fold protein YncE
MIDRKRTRDRLINAGTTAGIVLAGGGALLGCPRNDVCEEAPGVACVMVGTGELALGPDGLPARETDLYWAFDMEYAPDGTPYFIDWNNHLVRRINADGTVETVIGDFVGDGPPDMSDLTTGAPGLTVSLNHPTDIQFGPDGLMYLMAWHNHKIRTFDPSGDEVLVMCGRGAGYAGDGGSDLNALRFNQPKSLVRASDGTFYVLDQRNFLIRRITVGGMFSTIAGIPPMPGTMPMPGYEGDGGPATMARFRFEAGGNPEPSGGLALDETNGILYVADGLNYRIRAIDLESGEIGTVVGTGEAGNAGDDGPGASARISHVRDMEIGPDGLLYFADTDNHVIRAWDPATDVVTRIAGTGTMGRGAEGQSALATDLNRPFGIAFAPDGDLIVADTINSRFLRISR